MSKEALTLHPAGHYKRPYSLNHLAAMIEKRYKLYGDLRDLETAISLTRDALSLMPAGHPGHPTLLNGLSHSLLELHQRHMDLGDQNHQQYLEEIQVHITKALQDPYASVEKRLKMACDWARHVGTDPKFRLSLHSRSSILLQQYVIINPKILEQQWRLAYVRELTCIGAADVFQLASGDEDVELAVVMVEHGRSLLLGALQRYRSSVTTFKK